MSVCGGLNSQNFEGKDWGLTGISRAGGVAQGIQSNKKPYMGGVWITVWGIRKTV